MVGSEHHNYLHEEAERRLYRWTPEQERNLEARIAAARSVISQLALESADDSCALVGSTAKGWFDLSSDVDVVVISHLSSIESCEVSAGGFNISIVPITQGEVLPLLGLRYADLVSLRRIANLATAIPIVGKQDFFTAARDTNRRVTLLPDIAQFYRDFGASKIIEVEEDLPWHARLGATNSALQASLLLICACSPARLIKLKWTMKVVQATSPVCFQLCSQLLEMLGVVEEEKWEVIRNGCEAPVDGAFSISFGLRSQLEDLFRAGIVPRVTVPYMLLAKWAGVCDSIGEHGSQRDCGGDTDWSRVGGLLRQISEEAWSVVVVSRARAGL